MKILFVSAIMVLADQISKTLICSTMMLYESITVVPGFFHINYINSEWISPFGKIF